MKNKGVYINYKISVINLYIFVLVANCGAKYLHKKEAKLRRVA